MKKNFTVGAISLGLALFFLASPLVYAATSPSLGTADSFTVLSGTYTNTVPGTTISGDLGYTTPPAMAPTVNGTTHTADSTYNQAGIDQGTALTGLDSQSCTFTFAPGAIDLASDTTHGVVGTYAPGVYCITGAASIGGGGTLTLTGTGTYIFRMTGALTTSANSVVAVASGASACNVWWTPGAATTLGANSAFAGNDIDASGITIGNLVIWTGRALAFGGTVSTDSDTISSSTCATTSGTTTVTTTGTTTGSNSSNGVPVIPKTPGLPNTGESKPGHSNVVGALSLLAVGAGLVLVYTVRKRA